MNQFFNPAGDPSDVFDPSRHHIVAVDKVSKAHFHVTLDELARDARGILDSGPQKETIIHIEKAHPPVDLTPLLVRVDRLEAAKQTQHGGLDVSALEDVFATLQTEIERLNAVNVELERQLQSLIQDAADKGRLLDYILDHGRAVDDSPLRAEPHG